ncbi:MAG: conjugal transfer protein TraH [Candidatus Competibacteraceae bacterium]
MRLRLSLMFLLLVIAWPAQADLKDQMDRMFGDLVNVNQPAAFMGQRRGVLSGGSVVVRSRVMNPNLISIVPPSWKGGCGGIDLFAGSFSFISADEFVQLLRAIAANAKGYAFELALNAFCPSCQQEMARLSNIVRELTENLGNSCEMAHRLVNAAVPDTWQEVANAKSGLIAAQIGNVADYLEALRPHNGTTPAQNAAQGDPQKVAAEIQGNVVWRALQERQAAAWFRQGDVRLLEALMSLTGTVIVGPIPPGQQEHEVIELDHLLSLQDLLAGSSQTRPVTLWSCGDDTGVDGCLHPVKLEIELKGMRARVEDLLLGDTGMLAKARFNLGKPSDPELAFLQTAPPIVAMLRNLAVKDLGAAEVLAREAAPVIALELVVALVDELFRSVRLAVSLNPHHLGPKMLANLEAVQRQLAEERRGLNEQRSRLEDLVAYYNHLRADLRTGPYPQPAAAAPTATAAGQ